MSLSERTDVEVAIVGSGFSGICMGALLREAGIHSFVVLEKGQDVGGTWRENRYPGAACDVPSHLYSFSFAPNPRWSRAYSPQGEILEYLRRVASERGVLPHVRFGSRVESAAFDEAKARWTIRTKDGHVVLARSLVLGNGALHVPNRPTIAGVETFAGDSCHSAEWKDGLPIEGRRVGVIGTGASAIQIVPAIAPRARKLHLFQRTPAWVMPRNDHAYAERTKQLFSRHPRAEKLLRGAIYARAEATALAFLRPDAMKPLEWLARKHIARDVKDERLREALTPTYRMGCKRILISDDYYAAVCRENVDLVTTGIAAIEPGGVRTLDGRLHELDTLVYATGFDVAGYLTPISIAGLGGRDLASTWSASPAAYLGITISGFPNLFALMGPNTGLGHNSMIVMIEAQARYAVQAIRAIRERKLAYLDVRADVQRAFTAEIDEKMAKTVWATGCSSWYLAGGGRNSTLWPGFTFDYVWQTRRIDLDAFTLVGESRRVVPEVRAVPAATPTDARARGAREAGDRQRG